MIYKIDKNKIDEKILNETVGILRNGGIIIYPTDTAYAFGCDATNEAAADKIYRIKQRTKAKSMPVIAGSFEMVEDFFLLNKKEKEIGKRFWLNTPLPPLKGGTMGKGKLSIVLSVKKNVAIAESVIADDGTVAARVPDSLWACGLSLKLKKPIVSTSANLTGTDSCYSLDEIKKTGVAYDKIDLILDAGALSRVMPSTIVRVRNGKVEVLREGSGGILDL